MNTLQEACSMSCEKWVDSFPDDIPRHNFSRRHNKIIAKILCTDEKKYKVTFSKRNVKALIIAAILLSLSTTVFAVTASKEAIINKLANHSEYKISDTVQTKETNLLTVNYIPKDYKKVEEYTDGFYIFRYKNKDDEFTVSKYDITANISFDTEKYSSKKIKINNFDAVYYKSNNCDNGIIFNNGEYIFVVSGNISKDELVRIAQNVE